MNYCKNFDIYCQFALSDNGIIPCIGTQKQCNEFRSSTKQKTLGKKIYVYDDGTGTAIIQSKKGKTPDKTQYRIKDEENT